MMTKKDFILIADILRPQYKHLQNTEGQFDRVRGYEDAIDKVIDFMRDTNPRFNERRWRDYLAGKCGPNGGKLK